MNAAAPWGVAILIALMVSSAAPAAASPIFAPTLPGAPNSPFAQSAPSPTGTDATNPPPPPGVTFAPADAGAALPGAQAAADQAGANLANANLAVATDKGTIADDQGRLAILAGARQATASALVVALAERQRAHAAVVNSAVNAYVLGGVSPSATTSPAAQFALASTDAPAITQDAQLGLAHALQRHEDDLNAARHTVGSLDARLKKLNSAIPALVTEIATTKAALSAAVATQAQDRITARNADQWLALVRLVAPDPATGIPTILLDAYRGAAAYLHTTDPSCGLTWPDLAAIGQIESGQATFSGTRIAANGDTYPAILGPPLDGSAGMATLAATTPGIFDGGGPFERAVGPMQILPSTWASIAPSLPTGAVSDPNNIFSAALGAGIYLCRAAGPGGLSTTAGLASAYASYNHSAAYVSEAVGLEQHFSSGLSVPAGG